MHRAAARAVCIGHVRCGKHKHILLTVAQHKPLSVTLQGKLGIKLECIDIALRAPGDDNILLDRLAAEGILKRRTVKNAAVAYLILITYRADYLGALTHILTVLLLADLGKLLPRSRRDFSSMYSLTVSAVLRASLSAAEYSAV